MNNPFSSVFSSGAGGEKIPQHVGIIMDGNRRWARLHGLQALQGHSYVSNKVLEPLVDRAIERGVKFLTLWAFSTENWQRDQEEVAGLMDLFREAFQKNSAKLFEKGVRLKTIGDLSRFPQDIQDGLKEWIDKSAQNDKITVTFALNYGGRDEIIRGVKKMFAANPAAEITAENLAPHLDSAFMPDPDLIIRPGGEKRLSGFLTWGSPYAELYFTDVLMPDFSPEELDKALQEFSHRKRRFGK